MKIIGRNEEIRILSESVNSEKSELVVIYGRRRIGKTYLVRNYFNEQIIFEISGIHHGSVDDQLENFTAILSREQGLDLKQPKSWLAAFEMLISFINRKRTQKKMVLFFDEFPWLAGPKSKFLSAFENFWNVYASKKNNLIIIICGSAASFMIQNVLNNKGGLHNRVSRKIKLLPFTLQETAQFLQFKGIIWNHYDIVQMYMTMGGVPHYLEQIDKGESVAQSIDRIFFNPKGILFNEFKQLFSSLFENYNNHQQIVETLSSVNKGLIRDEIIKISRLPSGGSFSKVIEELIESGFVSKTNSFGKNVKSTIFRLTDEYCLFYQKFLTNYKNNGEGSWQRLSSKPVWTTWRGYAFENICLKHNFQIKKALGIDRIHSQSSGWMGESVLGKAQIDLLIDRDDNIINLCEIKFYKAEFAIDKKYAEELRRKVVIFQEVSKTRKNVFITFITSFGLLNNEYAKELVQNQITLDELF